MAIWSLSGIMVTEVAPLQAAGSGRLHFTN